MALNRIARLVDADAGEVFVLQGNIAFAIGCARGGIEVADGYPGTPSTEVIDKGLRFLQDRMRVGWSVNEATAVAVGFGAAMAGADTVVTMKIPGLFQAGDVIATMAGYTGKRGGLVLYIASDFVPSSTQYVTDPRYFLKSCMIPILEPRSHQEMLEVAPIAAELGRLHGTPVAVLANGLLCHSEGLVRLGEKRAPSRADVGQDFKRFMNLPEIARRNYESILGTRIPSVLQFAENTPLNRIEWNDRSMGVVVHGMTESTLREVWNDLPIKPSVLSLATTFPVPMDLVRRFAEGLSGPMIVLSDALRFVQEEIAAEGIRVEGKARWDARTEWTPQDVADRLGAKRAEPLTIPSALPIKRPPNICAGCPYRAFGLVVARLRKKKKITASFGDIGCNTLLFFLDAIDTCTCMGASDTNRQGAVIADPSLAGRSISVIGDSTECHSGLDATRNAVFRHGPGVKVILDNRTTAMTGGQPAPTSPTNLAGEASRFDLIGALKGEGAEVRLVDAFDMKAIEKQLKEALAAAAKGEFRVLVLRGECMMDVPARDKQPRYELVTDNCKQCDLCLVCSGIEKDEQGYPRYTHLCTGCGPHDGICLQTCHLDAIVERAEIPRPAPPPPLPPAIEEAPSDFKATLPRAIRIAVRGVGGQGNLFLGKVLAEVALLCGFDKIVKGETHGMAQLGGAVMSTFACGDVHSPILAPGSADALVALELSEVLRPGFLELLKPGGAIVLNQQRIVPSGTELADYPSQDAIRELLGTRTVVELDALKEARSIGDEQGRAANVIALGVLSTLPPLSSIPPSVWRKAIARVSPREEIQRANVAAFEQGRRVTSSSPRSRASQATGARA
jgi:indolepyruvate ferredoxin oxidoreductase, alpha subunit